MPWFVRGDVDGFFGLALDNLIQILLVSGLCMFVVGMPPEMIGGRILPGVVVSMLVGNLFYAWQAKKLAEKTGRTDICSLPYGINTPAVFVYVFLVMLPVRLLAQGNGMSAEDAAIEAWRAGLAACLGSGIIEFGGAFVAERIRRSTPRAAQLATLSGIALGFISMPFLFKTFAEPIVGFSTLAVIMLIYFGRRRFLGNIPGGLVAVVVGTVLCWATGVAGGEKPAAAFSFHFPLPVFGDLISALRSDYFTAYFSVILPMGIFNVLGSLQNIESAEAAGDSFDTRSSLMANGLGTIGAACFGSCFPTTIYIGHPGWKALGARAGYSILNAVFVTFICLTGTVAWISYIVPIEAGMAIVLWIGVVIAAQTFQATDRAHAPAAVIGIMIGVGAWAAILVKTAMRVTNSVAGDPIQSFAAKQEAFTTAFAQADLPTSGLFALEQGFIFTAMIFSTVTVHVIDKAFNKAAIWCLIGAALSVCGLLHSYEWGVGDVTLHLAPATRWAIAYVVMAGIFYSANWLTRDAECPGH